MSITSFLALLQLTLFYATELWFYEEPSLKQTLFFFNKRTKSDDSYLNAVFLLMQNLLTQRDVDLALNEPRVTGHPDYLLS
ncbi:hypothetical protein RRG08_011169 [Elysia crispata]|uniref:Uncharacterized protein n=1 Tax=Elysia crispata TaxID=231223 RepID=A0AAE1DQA7_9GAST|nr:hypothetical protein RRG08_011169 [Elysia crispata]